MIEATKQSITTILSSLTSVTEGLKPQENPSQAAMFRFQLEAFSHRLNDELEPGAVLTLFHPCTMRQEAYVVLCGPDTVTYTTHGHGMWIRNANPLSEDWSLSKSLTIAKKWGQLVKQQEEVSGTQAGFYVLFDPVFEKTPALNLDMCSRHVNTHAKVQYLDVVETDALGNVVVPKPVQAATAKKKAKAPTKSTEDLLKEAEAVLAAVTKAKAKGKGKGKAKAKAVAEAPAETKATKTAAKKKGAKAKATPAKAETKPAKKGAKAATKKAAKATPKARKGKGKKKAS